ncbi:LysR family transcriptional regulator [Mesorhizobium tianshanense]|uniref:DNA-binding transcriptional LysR family regulator n=1 Tax=Mesorhizobium tianshanense TaxID=39844 RepID=A0A562NYT7_9HYPH|nr:LysR family transcriptional regulator [Mesorhizobium tianshanense]TWI37387.1 DNA-binding transcriptional LysR family regulator [Mesorhizobium tianshanense]GLS35845.1 LysR family transcriptional regulator [Mesorhizobium tianshanense]
MAAQSSVSSHGVEWNDLEVVLAICRTGSLSGAARQLGNNHSTVFRKISAIEKRMGVRLFERLPTGYEMTEAGEAAMRYAERIEGEVHAMERELLGRDTRLRGKIRVSAPEGPTILILPSLIAEFRRQHPEVRVDLVMGLDAADLSRRETDIAVRVTRRPPEMSVGRFVCDFKFGIYAAPDYLARAGERDLKDHDWVMPHLVVDWMVPLVWKSREAVYESCVFTSNSVLACVEAARKGMGVSVISTFVVEGDDTLLPVTGPVEELAMELWVLTHPDLRRTARVAALMQFLVEKLSAQKPIFEGRPSRRLNEAG